jgi:hypothetical protein
VARTGAITARASRKGARRVPSAPCVRMRWLISRDGAGMGPGSDVTLELGVDGRGRVAGAALIDGPRRREVPAEGRGEWTPDGDLWHLEIHGIVSLTIRAGPRGLRALYARTDLLTALGISGGRYEFAGAVLLE